jgi:hypothetical protein
MNISLDSHLGNYIIPNKCEKKILVDIGANTGNFTVSQINNFEVIHFYEPYLPCFEIVKQRVSDNENVIGFNEAVYSKDGVELSMMAHDNHDAGSNGLKTDSLNGDWVEEICKVTTVSLDTILSRVGGRINYLKIDCETSEYYFFMDKNLNDIDYIAIELHWQMGKEKYEKLISFIKETHNCNSNLIWENGVNKEVLFINKKI